jgi:hypothetical protein
MISLSILLIGLVGMAQLQVYGMTATQGGRAHTVAMQLATELGAALERLPASDGRVGGAAGLTDDTPPAAFGRLLPLGIPTGSHIHTWSDDSPIPGARLDSTLERHPEDATKPLYARRWSVWNAGVTASGAAAKVIAVSVIYRERTLANPREVVVFVHSEIRGNFMANINAFN